MVRRDGKESTQEVAGSCLLRAVGAHFLRYECSVGGDVIRWAGASFHL